MASLLARSFLGEELPFCPVIIDQGGSETGPATKRATHVGNLPGRLGREGKLTYPFAKCPAGVITLSPS